MLKKIALLSAASLLVACGEPQTIEAQPQPPVAEAAASPAATATKQPAAKPESGAGFVVPDYQQLVLDNGLTVLLMEHHEVPLVSVNYVSKVGYVQDGSQYGLADLTAEALRLGSKQLSKTDIDIALDNMGTDLSVSTASEATVLSMDVMVEDLDASLGLLTSLVTEPVFPDDELLKLRDRSVAALKQQKEQPRSVIGNYFDALLYQGHPYAQPGAGTSETMAKLDRAQVKAFHNAYFAPQHAALVIAGDIQPEQVLAQVKSLWADWSNPQAKPIQPLSAPQLPNKPRVLLVDKPDAREATFVIGGPGVDYSHSERVPLHVLNTVLGGRFTSWLNDELRVNAGLTYGARSSFVPRKQAGAFLLSTFTDAKDAEAGIDLALKTYARLWETGLDQATLDSAKAYVKGGFPPKYETHSDMAQFLLQSYAYGIGVDFINQFVTKVDDLTLDVSKQLVEQVFPKQDLQFVVIGPADQLRDMVTKYGEVIEVSITQPGFEPVSREG